MYQELAPRYVPAYEQPEEPEGAQLLDLTVEEFEQLDPHLRLLAAIEGRNQTEDPTFTSHTEMIEWMQAVSGLERQALIRVNRFLHGEHDFMHLETDNGKRMVVDPLGKKYLEAQIALFRQSNNGRA